jgi:hypothetical protein
MNDDWQPGDVAICVDVEWKLGLKELFDIPLKLGASYTVVGCGTVYGEMPNGELRTVAALTLLEAKNPLCKGGVFGAFRFVKRRSLLDENERETSRELDPEAA